MASLVTLAWNPTQSPRQSNAHRRLYCAPAFRANRVRLQTRASSSDSQPATAPGVPGVKPNSTTSGCSICGRESIAGGCNGEGRMQGGIATIPGFRWWPIKVYRPCPDFIKAGGVYKRQGQSLDEVAFGRQRRGDDKSIQERLQGKGE